ncbi:MAG: hypothetical protein IPL97_08790 [Niastella sp.]|nr:hypothetical protein [Niastella sp.]
MHFKWHLLWLLLISCNPAPANNKKGVSAQASGKASQENNVVGNIADIPLPTGFSRVSFPQNSFAAWLRKINLKEDKTVYLYDGQLKRNQQAQYAVLDISIGERNLQQCADAVMRLRAEYLYAQKKFDSLKFIDNEGGVYTFQKPYTRTYFDSYLQKVFGICGSASLARQMQIQNWNSIEPGDVIIRGGFPGHAVTIMDIAKNEKGEVIYLLSQSYMPAQSIHILKNPVNEDLSPWYIVNDEAFIQTPEYTFKREELKQW